jgi:hypothetical protein
MTIQEYRKEAIERLELYRMRYQGQDSSFVPLNIAQRWLNAFESEEVDLDEIASIMREAEKDKDRYDIAFYTFCNEMRKIHRALWEDFLTRGESAKP